MSLVPNPSHLETVDPVVLGKVRAQQTFRDDLTRHEQVLPVLIHGDAAFAGQGIVWECLGFSGVSGYNTGGCIHFIVNNQIGFTTSPQFSRGSPYPSDVAKGVQAPILHINGDRKSVEEGKSVAERVELRGRRIIKKKTTKEQGRDRQTY